MEEKIRAKIARLTEQRETFLTQANQQIAALNGAIEALNQLLAPEPAAAETPAAPEASVPVSQNGTQPAEVTA